MSPDPPALTILLADDHHLLRHGIRHLLERQPGWQVVGEAGSGREAVALAERLQPRVAVLDVQMPEMSGLEAVRHLRQSLPSCALVIFSGVETREKMDELFAAGARSYVLKTDPPESLLAAIEAASRGKPHFSEAVSEILFARILARGEPLSKPAQSADELNERDRETLKLLAQGKTNKEVAALLSLSVKAIEKRRSLLMRKLDLQNYSEMVRFALREGIIG